MTEGRVDTAETGEVARFCGSCGAPRDAASTNFCRNCGLSYADSDRAATQPASLAFAPKAGFWRRTFAYLLDALVLGVIAFVIGFGAGFLGLATGMSEGDITLLANVLGNIIGVVYFIFFWSARGKGQTLGMRWLGMRVVRTDGSYIGLGRAFLRSIGLGLSFLVLFIGVIFVAFDKNKQGWHDKIADTYVVMA